MRFGRWTILLTCFGMAVPVASEDISSSVPQQSAEVAQGGETLHYTIIGTRFGNRFKWIVGPDGKGEIAIPFSIGHLIAGADSDYYFLYGEHPIDIGPEGYAELRSGLAPVIENGGIVISLDGPASDCSNIRAMDLGAAQLRWTNGEKEGMAIADFACRDADKAEGEKLARFDQAWQVLGRRLSAQGGNIAIAIPNGSKPFEWNDTLRYSEFNGRSHRIFTIEPDGTGKIFATYGWNHGAYSDPDHYSIPDGESRFAMGKAGYLKVRALLDDIVAGRTATMDRLDSCKSVFSTSARIGTLKWADSADHVGYRFDSSCNSAENGRVWGMLEQAFFHIGRNLVKPD